MNITHTHTCARAHARTYPVMQAPSREGRESATFLCVSPADGTGCREDGGENSFPTFGLFSVFCTTWEANGSQEHPWANRCSSSNRTKIWQGPPGAKEPVTVGILDLGCSSCPSYSKICIRNKGWLALQCKCGVSLAGLCAF